MLRFLMDWAYLLLIQYIDFSTILVFIIFIKFNYIL